MEVRSGAPVFAVQDAALAGNESANVRFAGAERPHHLIHFDPYYVEHLDHLVAHECGHILRWTEAPPSERVLPTMTRKTLRKARRRLALHVPHLERQGLPKDMARGMIDFWVRGLVTQVTNFPVDIRIERLLHAEYPELREAQRASLGLQLAEYRLGMAPQIRAFSPAKVFQIANAINYVYAVEIGRLIGEPEAAAAYDDAAVRGFGDRLLREVGDGHAGDHSRDRETADTWARIAGIRGWYRWADPFGP